MELVNEWFTTGKFRNVDTHLRTESSYENELFAAIPLTRHPLHKAEFEYHGKIWTYTWKDTTYFSYEYN